MNELKHLMDEQVESVYVENSKFDSYLAAYYSTRDADYLKQMWPIVFRCSCNILKKKYGKKWKSEKIQNKAIDICNIVFGRITNFNKWKDGYQIKNLPTVVSYAVLNVTCSSKALKEQIEDSYISFETVENYEEYRTEPIRGICRKELMNTPD